MNAGNRNVPRRGDIFWADFPLTESVGSEQHKERPALVVSADAVNFALPVCIVVPLSTQMDKWRQHRIRIHESDKIQEPGTAGCPGESLALTEQIRVVSVERLSLKRIACLKPAAMAKVEAGIRYVLAIP